MDSFVYCWKDISKNMMYIGMHTGSKDDGYVCSSKNMLKEYNQRPFDFKRKILKIGSKQEMFDYETKLLKKVNARKNPKFYNLSNNDGIKINNGNSKITRKKISESLKGNTYASGVRNKEQKQKMKDAHKMRTKYAKGWKFTTEQKNRHKIAIRKHIGSLSEKEKKEKYGKKTEKRIAAIQSLNSIKISCPHCKKEGQMVAMKRWHFDNCKQRII